MIEKEFTYSPLGKWGARFTGMADVEEYPYGEIVLHGKGKLTKTPAPLWRRIVFNLWIRWWWKLTIKELYDPNEE